MKKIFLFIFVTVILLISGCTNYKDYKNEEEHEVFDDLTIEIKDTRAIDSRFFSAGTRNCRIEITASSSNNNYRLEFWKNKYMDKSINVGNLDVQSGVKNDKLIIFIESTKISRYEPFHYIKCYYFEGNKIKEKIIKYKYNKTIAERDFE